MSNESPITALTVVTSDMAGDLAEVSTIYARMLDELATMVETSRSARTIQGHIVMQRLGQLHVELDELPTVTSDRTVVVAVANGVLELITFVEDRTAGQTFRALLSPLRELHAELLDQVVAHGWAVSA